MQILRSLAVQESAYHDFTHEAMIRAGLEVSETLVATPQTFKLGALPLGVVLERAVASLVLGFAAKSDTAFDTTTVTVKILDNAGADKTVIFTALELNWHAAGVVTGDTVFKTPTAPAAAGDTMVAIVTGKAAKALSALSEGELALYFDFNEPFWLNNATGPRPGPGGFSLQQRAELTGKTIEQVKEEDKAELEKAQGKKDDKKGEPGQPGQPHAEAVDYEEKTVPELKELAKERGIDVPYDARKDEIISALEKADKNGAKKTAHHA